jgi:hypothetical protein
MHISDCIACQIFPCSDVRHECYVVPGSEIDSLILSVLTVAKMPPGS